MTGSIVRSSISRPLVDLQGVGPAALARSGGSAGGCTEYPFRHDYRYANGLKVSAEEITRRWNDDLRSRDPAVAWLLEFVDGAADVVAGRSPNSLGLRVSAEGVEICLTEPSAEMEERLRHPKLWHWRPSAEPGVTDGPGPFLDRGSAEMVARTSDDPTPRVDRVIQVSGDDPALLMRLGETDVAIGWGREGGSMLEAAGSRYRVTRLPGWDRIYALWLEPGARWLNDPVFRRWLASRIERGSMLEYLFEGRGDAVTSLLSSSSDPRWVEVDRRPVSQSSEPRFVLGYDIEDTVAERVAARIRARLAGDRVSVELRAVSSADLVTGVRSGTIHAAIVVHEPSLEDPVLAIRETCACLGPGADAARTILRQSGGLPGSSARMSSALAAERALLDDARLVPLIRLHAYVAVDRNLEDFAVGAPGVVDFAAAWWRN